MHTASLLSCLNYSNYRATRLCHKQEIFMLLAEFSMWPMDKGESVGKYVARLLDIIDRSGLPYRLGPLGTCVEGDFDAVMAVIRQCHESLAADCNRIACTIKMDY